MSPDELNTIAPASQGGGREGVRAAARRAALRHQRPSTIKRGLTLLERLAESFLDGPEESNTELIRRMRAAHFADVEELLKSGKLKLPR